MRLLLILALSFLSARFSCATEAASPQSSRLESAPQLMHLERVLIQKQDARDKGTLPLEKYQEFIAQFREELDAVMGRIPPTPENNGLYAQILARLGEKERGQALESLEQALAGSPESPALLVAKGSILYEQRDYQAAAALAQQAWEASGHKDARAWALLKMSEGRISGGSSTGPAPRVKPASDFAQLDWSIPEKHDINAQAMGFIHQAIAARNQRDMTATWSNAQAAMNADPTSVAVQKLYEAVKADRLKHADTKAFLDQAVASMREGRAQESVVWAQKAYDRNPTDDTYAILQETRRRNAEVLPQRPAEPKKAPADSSPFLPILLLSGTGLAAYGGYQVSKSKATRTADEGLNPNPYVSPEQARRNYVNSAVYIGAPIVIFGLVYGGPVVWRAATSVVAAAWQRGGVSLQRTLASEAGAINPGEAQALSNAAKAGASRLIPGFNAVESQVIYEAQQILNSPQFVELQQAYKAGRPAVVTIGGRLIQYEPDIPMGYSGITNFQKNGFAIGRQAFSSVQELQKTVLHELHRLATSQSAGGLSGTLVRQETGAAHQFADRAVGALR